MDSTGYEIVDNDAILIGERYAAAKGSLTESVRLSIECGQMLIAKKSTMKHGEWMPWLEHNQAVLGFSTRKTAAALMRAAGANVTSTSHLTDESAQELSRKIWGNTNHRAQGTGENEWYTPEEYIVSARAVMGGIDLDPASSDIAQQWIQAGEYRTDEDDGLTGDWQGRVWLNPPYAQPLIMQFIEKLVSEVSEGRVSQAILLTHNYTDTAWFHHAESIAEFICFTRGRIPFVDRNGEVCSPTQGQAFFYFGDNTKAFVDEFGKYGFIR